MTPYYEHAGITIYHGDSREIAPSLGCFDLLLTDPPYGIGYAANPIVGKGKTRSNHAKMEWDDEAIDESVLEALRSKAFKQIIFGGNYYALPAARCILSWFKPDAPPSMGNVEYAWTNLDQNSRMISHSIAATNAERVGHPTQKPLRVISWALQQAGELETVFDPFMGSGTVLRACKDAGKFAVGIEREEKYCELASKRLEQEVFAF